MPPRATGAIVIKIPKTKNRQPGHRDGSGTLMYITPSKANDDLDPYWWILDQFQRRRAACAPSTAPFFADPHGRPITRAHLVTQVEKRLQAAAKGADVTLHSPRIGIVNYMRAAGSPPTRSATGEEVFRLFDAGQRAAEDELALNVAG
jgi:hypothetical protein